MSHAEICPVCKGAGKKTTNEGVGITFTPCIGCLGKGWVEVKDDTPVPGGTVVFSSYQTTPIGYYSPGYYVWHPY